MEDLKSLTSSIHVQRLYPGAAKSFLSLLPCKVHMWSLLICSGNLTTKLAVPARYGEDTSTRWLFQWITRLSEQ